MQIRDLLEGSIPAPMAPEGSDPLRQEDILQEAQLLSAHMDAVSSAVGLLIELRTAMHVAEGNTAVLVGRGVRDCLWSTEGPAFTRTAWNIVGSAPSFADGIFG